MVKIADGFSEDIHVWGVSNTQLAWIKRTLLEIPVDYSVLIFSHIGTYDIESFLTNKIRGSGRVDTFPL